MYACNYQITTTPCLRKHRSEVKAVALILHALETAVFAPAHLSATALNNQEHKVKATTYSHTYFGLPAILRFPHSQQVSSPLVSISVIITVPFMSLLHHTRMLSIQHHESSIPSPTSVSLVLYIPAYKAIGIEVDP